MSEDRQPSRVRWQGLIYYIYVPSKLAENQLFKCTMQFVGWTPFVMFALFSRRLLTLHGTKLTHLLHLKGSRLMTLVMKMTLCILQTWSYHVGIKIGKVLLVQRSWNFERFSIVISVVQWTDFGRDLIKGHNIEFYYPIGDKMFKSSI